MNNKNNNYYNISKKQKYINNKNIKNGSVPGVWQYSSNNNLIENETQLRSKQSYVHRNSFETPNEFEPKNYTIPLQSKLSKKNVQFNRLPGTHYGPGKGIGNLDVLNDLRSGSATRLDSNQWKINKEQKITNRFEYLDRNVQNPNNIVMPFPRGGEMTRKSGDKKEEYNIEFKY